MRKTIAAMVALAAVLSSVPKPARAQSGLQQAVAERAIVLLKADTIAASAAVPQRGTDARVRPHHDLRVLSAVAVLERRYGFRASRFFTRAVRGFSATLTMTQSRLLAADPAVESIEPDNAVSIGPIAPAAQIVPWGITQIGADASSQQSGDGSGEVADVNVYVIDSGIDATHPDLNVVGHVTFTDDGNFDCNGHGTAVAGVIAARDNGDHVVGVAPGAPLTGVKVLNCNGTAFTSVLLEGIDWVTANAVKPAVANVSLGSAIRLRSVNQAVRASAQSGIFYALSAGNGNPLTGEAVDACSTSPAGAGIDFGGFPNNIVTVGATDVADEEAGFSNFGPCVDMWAPGVGIDSTWLMTSGGGITASGTSLASPYVAGAAALVLSQHPTVPLWYLEALLEAVADLPGTTSADGRPIKRLSVRLF